MTSPSCERVNFSKKWSELLNSHQVRLGSVCWQRRHSGVQPQGSFVMGQLQRRHLCRIAIAASGLALMLGGSALAQTVQMFEDAPSVEQLRSIMVPESQPSASRSIVIQRPDTGAASVNVQHVATQPLPAARTPAATGETPASSVKQVAASASEVRLRRRPRNQVPAPSPPRPVSGSTSLSIRQFCQTRPMR